MAPEEHDEEEEVLRSKQASPGKLDWYRPRQPRHTVQGKVKQRRARYGSGAAALPRPPDSKGSAGK